MATIKGRSGYIYSDILVSVPLGYTGGGVAGIVGGTTPYTLAVRERNKKMIRPRQDTTDGPYSTGVGGPIAMQVKFVGYFKGEFSPPSSFQNEYLYIEASVCLGFIGVILVEDFTEVGVIDGALHFEISGTSDGPFVNNDIAGA